MRTQGKVFLFPTSKKVAPLKRYVDSVYKKYTFYYLYTSTFTLLKYAFSLHFSLSLYVIQFSIIYLYSIHVILCVILWCQFKTHSSQNVAMSLLMLCATLFCSPPHCNPFVFGFLSVFVHKAGLEIGEMILAVNKDPLLGSNYENVSIETHLFFYTYTIHICAFIIKCEQTRLQFSVERQKCVFFVDSSKICM